MKIIFFILILQLCSCSLASALTLGVSPSDISLTLAKSTTAKKEFYIQAYDSLPVNLTIETEGRLESSIKPSRRKLTLNNETKKLSFKITAPEHLENNVYAGRIVIKPDIDKKFLNMVPSVSLKINLNITGEEVVDTKITEFQAEDSEENQSIYFDIKMENNGNVVNFPMLVINISQLNNSWEFRKALGEINPGEERIDQVEFKIENISLGNYSAVAHLVIQNNKTNLSHNNFSIFSKGTFSRNASIKNITFSAPIQDKEMKITVPIQNTGKFPIQSKVVIEIYKDHVFEKHMESEELTIKRDEIKEIDLFYIPEASGSYTIQAKIYYEGKESKKIETEFTIKNNLQIITANIVKSEATGGVFIIALILIGFFIWRRLK